MLQCCPTCFRDANGGCCSKLPLRQDFRESLLYISKLSLEPDDHQVATFACAEVVLSTHCCPPNSMGRMSASQWLLSVGADDRTLAECHQAVVGPRHRGQSNYRSQRVSTRRFARHRRPLFNHATSPPQQDAIGPGIRVVSRSFALSTAGVSCIQHIAMRNRIPDLNGLGVMRGNGELAIALRGQVISDPITLRLIELTRTGRIG